MNKGKNLFILLVSVNILFLNTPLSLANDLLSSYTSSVSQIIVSAIRGGQFSFNPIFVEKLRTVVDIYILPDGTVEKIKIIDSSGVKEFDEEVKNFVERLTPYPFLPQGIDSLRVRLPIEVAGSKVLEEEVTLAPVISEVEKGNDGKEDKEKAQGEETKLEVRGLKGEKAQGSGHKVQAEEEKSTVHSPQSTVGKREEIKGEEERVAGKGKKVKKEKVKVEDKDKGEVISGEIKGEVTEEVTEEGQEKEETRDDPENIGAGRQETKDERRRMNDEGQEVEDEDKEKVLDTFSLKEEMSEKFLQEKEKMINVVVEAEGMYQLALANSDSAKVAHQQVNLANLKINEARRNLFPKMDLQYSESEGKTITDPYESKAYAVQLRQNLYDKGKTIKTLRKEQLNLDVAKGEYEKTIQELKSEVVRSYLNVVGKEEELKDVESFKEEVSKDYELAKSIYEAGGITRVEFIEIEAEYERTLNTIEQVDNELKLAREKLRASMNLSPESEVEFQEKKLPNLGELAVDVSECIDLALTNKPEVRLWEISLKASEYAKDIARNENVPRFDVVTSYGASGEAYSSQSLDLADEWKLMGVVTWLFGGNSFEVSTSEDRVSSKDITELSRKTEAATYSAKLSVLDKMQYYTQRKEADIAYAQNLSNLSKNKQEVVFDTRKSYLEYKQSFDEYQVALFEDKFSGVNLELKEESFKVGKANLSEIVKGRADYMRKKLALVRAKTSYYISLAGLDKATAYSLGLFSNNAEAKGNTAEEVKEEL